MDLYVYAYVYVYICMCMLRCRHQFPALPQYTSNYATYYTAIYDQCSLVIAVKKNIGVKAV